MGVFIPCDIFVVFFKEIVSSKFNKIKKLHEDTLALLVRVFVLLGDSL